MAKKPEAVATFLSDLAVKLQPLREEEFKLFLQYKKEEVSGGGGGSSHCERKSSSCFCFTRGEGGSDIIYTMHANVHMCVTCICVVVCGGGVGGVMCVVCVCGLYVSAMHMILIDYCVCVDDKVISPSTIDYCVCVDDKVISPSTIDYCVCVDDKVISPSTIDYCVCVDDKVISPSN